MTSVVMNLDLDGVPLRTSLRLCLAQLDLTYNVKDGLLSDHVSVESNDESWRSAANDAYQVVTLRAADRAGIGGRTCPLFAGLCVSPCNKDSVGK